MTSSPKARAGITTAVISAIIACVSVYSAVEAQTPPNTSIGNVSGSTQIVTQNQNGNNTIDDGMLVFHGVATISPPVEAKCAPSTLPLVFIGSAIFHFMSDDYVVIHGEGKNILEFKLTPDGVMIKQLLMMNKDRKTIASVNNGRVSYFSGAREPEITKSSFILYDQNSNEIFSIKYESTCTLLMSAAFYVNGWHLDFTDSKDVVQKTIKIGYNEFGGSTINVRDSGDLVIAPFIVN